MKTEKQKTSLGSFARRTLAGIVLGAQVLVLSGGLASCSKESTPTYSQTFDSARRVIRRDYDDNGDGVVDEIANYTLDSTGRRTKEEIDNNADGVADGVANYTHDSTGRVIRREYDDNGDGRIDRIVNY